MYPPARQRPLSKHIRTRFDTTRCSHRHYQSCVREWGDI